MTTGGAKPPALSCPACGVRYPAEERFCGDCAMPLMPSAGAGPLEVADSDAHGRARKIDPRYVQGELVRVAGGRHLAEAELIQGILLEEGVPSILRRSAGFDVPDFLAAGPRDVLVPEAGAQVAREALLGTDMEPREGPPPQPGDQTRLAVRLGLAVLGGGVITALVTWGLLEAGGGLP